MVGSIPLFNSVTTSRFKSGGRIPASETNLEDISPTITYCILGGIFGIVLLVLIRVAISIRKDRKSAKEKAKRDKEFIRKLMDKKKTT